MIPWRPGRASELRAGYLDAVRVFPGHPRTPFGTAWRIGTFRYRVVPGRHGGTADQMTHPPPTHRPADRDWRTMTRHDFDATAPPPVLFDLAPGQTASDDGCGTGDLFELLDASV